MYLYEKQGRPNWVRLVQVNWLCLVIPHFIPAQLQNCGCSVVVQSDALWLKLCLISPSICVGLWGIVNNAGRSLPMGPSEWMKVEDFHSTLKVNMNGVIGMTMTFLPLIKKARGRIVNVASVLGRVAANGGGYCISKFAVESFSDCLR